MHSGTLLNRSFQLLLAATLGLAGCKKIDEPTNPADRAAPAAPASSRIESLPLPASEPVVATPLPNGPPPLSPLFKDIEKRTFQFFWDTTNEANGMTPDRFPSRPFASIASIGFALTAYPIGIENGWISRRQAVDRTLVTLKFLRDARMGPQKEGTAGYKGYFYHFLDMQKGARFESWVELSSVDTGLLMMGVLFAQSYYDRDDAREKEIRELADTLYRRVEWPYLQKNNPPLIGMGWYPERGFIKHDWAGYNEAMLLYVLALGSPTHPVEADAWTAWTATYDRGWGKYGGEEYLSFAPLFGHQYSHVWIDFRGIQDAYTKRRGIDYFENSRRATLAQRNYAIDNPMKWKEYGKDVWGLTASDGPQVTTQTYNGEQRQFRHYSARGAGIMDAFDDGTIAPTAAIASLPFAPEEVIAATEAMHERYGDFLYSSYGFLDAFNPSFTYDIPLKTGRLVPDKGWVASDYIGIDQGPILTMIANYRNGFVWDVIKRNKYIRDGLTRAGFSGGWLAEYQNKDAAAASEAGAGNDAAAAGKSDAAADAASKAAAGKAAPNTATPGKTTPGKATQGKATQGKTTQGKTTQGKATQSGKAAAAKAASSTPAPAAAARAQRAQPSRARTTLAAFRPTLTVGVSSAALSQAATSSAGVLGVPASMPAAFTPLPAASTPLPRPCQPRPTWAARAA